MQDDILREIVQELKRLRSEVFVTNRRLGATVDRLDATISPLDVLEQSVIVFRQGLSEVHGELQNIRELLSDHVI